MNDNQEKELATKVASPSPFSPFTTDLPLVEAIPLSLIPWTLIQSESS